MNTQAISGSQTHFLLSFTKQSLHGAFPRHISFNNNTHVTKQRISIRTPSRLRPKAAAGSTLYAPAPVKETLYELLEISESGSLSEIKRAYKKMALKYHPDVSPADRTEEYTTKFIRVQEAYETLSDPEARAMYDSLGLSKDLHMAFSGRKGSRVNEEMCGWKTRWQSQIMDLKKKSVTNTSRVDSRGRMSWGARIRKQRSESSSNGFN